MAADKIILVHNGALGDFLIAWPAALALARAYGPSAALFYAGRESYTGWAAAAGFEPAPADIRAAVDRLYAAEDWSDPALTPLAGSLVVWIGLAKAPVGDALLRQQDEPRLVFMPMLGHEEEPERESTRHRLARLMRERLHVQWPEDADEAWRQRVARHHGGNGDVLLFPGAGHRAKEWPAERWRNLARRLMARGIACRFALGPAELERGFDAQDIPTVAPDSLDELGSLLANASLVVCADTGPIHLAALSGTPALALFGPTSAKQWAPEGIEVLRSDAACRPCSRTTRSIQCEPPECMAAISVEQVERRILTILKA